MILVIKANKIQPLQDLKIIKANQVEEDQPVVSKVENLLNQRLNAKRTYLSSEEIYHLLEEDAEKCSARWQ